jgi:hypothetical protein
MCSFVALAITLSLLTCTVSPSALGARLKQDKRSREVLAEIRAEKTKEQAARNTWSRLLEATKNGRWKAAGRFVGREVKFRAFVSRWEERSLLLRDSTQLSDPSAPQIVAMLSEPLERYPADSIVVEVSGAVGGVNGGEKVIKVRADSVRVVMAD